MKSFSTIIPLSFYSIASTINLAFVFESYSASFNYIAFIANPKNMASSKDNVSFGDNFDTVMALIAVSMLEKCHRK